MKGGDQEVDGLDADERDEDAADAVDPKVPAAVARPRTPSKRAE